MNRFKKHGYFKIWLTIALGATFLEWLSALVTEEIFQENSYVFIIQAIGCILAMFLTDWWLAELVGKFYFKVLIINVSICGSFALITLWAIYFRHTYFPPELANTGMLGLWGRIFGTTIFIIRLPLFIALIITLLRQEIVSTRSKIVFTLLIVGNIFYLLYSVELVLKLIDSGIYDWYVWVIPGLGSALLAIASLVTE